ncbi:hypothetical protein ACFL1R_05725 [Candidatus Latescibacterota bacterium]
MLLKCSGIKTSGKHLLILERLNIVGKPLANIMLPKESDAIVNICHNDREEPNYYTTGRSKRER